MLRSALAATAFALTVAATPVLAQVTPAPANALTYSQAVPLAGVVAIQQKLQQQGVYSGRTDGIWGPDSQAALERFQQTHGLQVTGQLNQGTVATLGLSSDQILTSVATPTAPAAPIVGNALSPASVRTVQLRLRGLNFYGGAIDGLWGGSTSTAIERFQRSRGLQADGQLNPATMTALGLDPNAMVQSR